MLQSFLQSPFAALAQTTTPANTEPTIINSSIDSVRSMLGIPADSVLFQNTPYMLLVALAIFASVLFLAYIVRQVLLIRLRKIAKKTTTHLDDLAVELIADLRPWSIVPIALGVACSILVLPETLQKALKILIVIALGAQVLLSSRLVVDHITKTIVRKSSNKDGIPDPNINTATGIIKALIQAILAVAVLLLILENLDIRVTPLLGALGLGGIAIALATQNILADLFASLIIVFDKPFHVGDFIIVGEKMGVVDSIGIKTTRIKALSGEQIVFCNADLLSSRLHNYKRMIERRVVQTYSVTYETPHDKLQRIPDLIRACTVPDQSQVPIRFDRCHLKSLAAYSLDYELVYYVLSGDFNIFAKEQNRINLSIIETFAREKIDFAYPTSLEYQALAPGAAKLAITLPEARSHEQNS